LVAYVDQKLHHDWSPEQITGRIRRDHPRDPQMCTSTETIYRWVYTAALTGQMQSIPSELRQTLTLDNGSEMSRFKEFEAATGLNICL